MKNFTSKKMLKYALFAGGADGDFLTTKKDVLMQTTALAACGEIYNGSKG